VSANKPYEKELKKYSPESVQRGMAHPNLKSPDHETLVEVKKPQYPELGKDK
jgi:hypothetical protein